ncbi:hypothetical protein [Flavobacterium bizetiae]|uniref:hypothetical protein n=1 Tax=Flavobacterium bizetiae TaxID=2704140 RepID=UPI003757092A
MEEIDFFEGYTNQEFIDYYTVDLYSRMEITLYTYPHEFVEEDPIPWEHLNRCEQILYDYLYNCYEASKFKRWQQKKDEELKTADTQGQQPDSADIEESEQQRAEKYAQEQKERETAVKAKMMELAPEINKVTDNYMQSVKLTFKDL